MGNNSAYTIWEEQVIGLEKAGRLDAEVLDIVSHAFARMDIDQGGCQYLKSSNGMLVEQLAVSLLNPSFKFLEKQDFENQVAGTEAYRDYDDYCEAEYEEFCKLEKRWNW